MARVDHHENGALIVVAESPEERALVAHGRQAGGALVLLEGLYDVGHDTVLLPGGISERAAQRVRRALEQAASSHQEARRRRRAFRLVKD